MTTKKKDDAQFPNGNLESELERLIKQYRSCAKDGAASTIKMAETVAEVIAKGFLANQANKFWDEFQISESKRSKLETIAKAASRFDPYLEKCPSSWTTLYVLAKLKSDQFDRVTQDERFTPTITAAEIDEILTGKSGGGKQLPTDCSIKGINASQKREEICNELVLLADEYGFECVFSQSLDKAVAPAETVSLPERLRKKRKMAVA